MFLRNLLQLLKRNNIIKYFYYQLFNPTLTFSIDSIQEYYLFKKTGTPWLSYHTLAFEEKINTLFNEWSKIVEQEYIIHYRKPCFIEPYYGWIIVDENRVIKESLPYGILE